MAPTRTRNVRAGVLQVGMLVRLTPEHGMGELWLRMQSKEHIGDRVVLALEHIGTASTEELVIVRVPFDHVVEIPKMVSATHRIKIMEEFGKAGTFLYVANGDSPPDKRRYVFSDAQAETALGTPWLGYQVLQRRTDYFLTGII